MKHVSISPFTIATAGISIVILSIAAFLLLHRPTTETTVFHPLVTIPLPSKTLSLTLGQAIYTPYSVQTKGTKIEVYEQKNMIGQLIYSTDNPDEKRLVIEEKSIMLRGKKVFFIVSPLPTGCEDPVTDSCLRFLAKIGKEYTQYGGIWLFDIETKKFTHLFKRSDTIVVNTTQRVDFIWDTNNNEQLLKFKVTITDESNESIKMYQLNPQDGSITTSP